jgi:4-hydroxybenzoate polyprenyltransferase
VVSPNKSSEREASALRQLDVDELNWGTLSDWAQLVRLPNAFTLVSNTVAAGLVVGSYLLPAPAFAVTLVASLFAYWAGMILNDIVDLEEDRQWRPTRPLVQARISPVIAGHVANFFLMLGPVLILAITNLYTSQKEWMGAAFLASLLLSLTVRSYNTQLKRTFLGPILMGLCRSLNILMVGLTMLAVGGRETFPIALLWFSAGIGLYIMGVTVYARREETESQSNMLGFGLTLEVAGLSTLAGFPVWSRTEHSWGLDPQVAYPLLILLIGLTVVQRGIAGVLRPVPPKVQLAVKHAILTLIMIDAAVAVLWAGPWFGAAVALMLLPAFISALRVRTT